jgi:hypothetical protein
MPAPAQPFRYLASGRRAAQFWLILALFFGALVRAGVVELSPIQLIAIGTVYAAVFATLLLGTRWLQKRAALYAEKAMLEDTRPPVLYLRPFQQDVAGERVVSILSALGLNAAFFTFTLEERLTALFWNVGPVISVGRPGEKLPPIGAARLYLGEAEWQDKVAQLMKDARLVVISVGETQGVLWELAQLAGRCEPRKILVFIFARRKKYGEALEVASRYLPKPLPPSPGFRKPLCYAFDDTWTPIALPWRRAWALDTSAPGSTLVPSLRSFMERNGIEVPAMKPAVRPRVILLWAAVGLATYTLLYFLFLHG